MDAEMIERVAGAVRSGSTPDEAWSRLLDLAQADGGRPSASLLRGIPVGQHVATFAVELGAVLASEPPPHDVDTLYLGLLDVVELESREHGVAVGLAGLASFPGDQPDCMLEPSWLPRHRVLTSRLVDAVHALAETDPANADYYAEGLALGAVALLARFSADSLSLDLRLAVGRDHGPCFAVR